MASALEPVWSSISIAINRTRDFSCLAAVGLNQPMSLEAIYTERTPAEASLQVPGQQMRGKMGNGVKKDDGPDYVSYDFPT